MKVHYEKKGQILSHDSEIHTHILVYICWMIEQIILLFTSIINSALKNHLFTVYLFELDEKSSFYLPIVGS